MIAIHAFIVQDDAELNVRVQVITPADSRELFLFRFFLTATLLFPALFFRGVITGVVSC